MTDIRTLAFIQRLYLGSVEKTGVSARIGSTKIVRTE
jgi:hypothetical protein